MVAPGEGGAAGKEDVASPVLMELLGIGGAGHGLFLLQYVLQGVLHLILVEQANTAAKNRSRNLRNRTGNFLP